MFVHCSDWATVTGVDAALATESLVDLATATGAGAVVSTLSGYPWEFANHYILFVLHNINQVSANSNTLQPGPMPLGSGPVGEECVLFIRIPFMQHRANAILFYQTGAESNCILLRVRCNCVLCEVNVIHC